MDGFLFRAPGSAPELLRKEQEAAHPAYRTYVIGVKVPKGSVPQALYWDTMDAHHYIRMVQDDILLVGGEDHKIGQNEHSEACFERLEAWARERLPFADRLCHGGRGKITP